MKVAKGRILVGKYELGKTIGEGSFAKVKFARNVQNGNYVAIKILDRKHVLRLNMMEQLMKEISTMKLINHPNVVRILEVPNHVPSSLNFCLITPSHNFFIIGLSEVSY